MVLAGGSKITATELPDPVEESRDVDHMILAALLRQYLRGDTPFMEGRLLLTGLFTSSYEVLTGATVVEMVGWSKDAMGTMSPVTTTGLPHFLP